MIQEYLAFGTFLTALLIAASSLVRFIIIQIKSKEDPQCSPRCNCKVQNNNTLTPRPLHIKGNNHRHRRRSM